MVVYLFIKPCVGKVLSTLTHSFGWLDLGMSRFQFFESQLLSEKTSQFYDYSLLSTTWKKTGGTSGFKLLLAPYLEMMW